MATSRLKAWSWEPKCSATLLVEELVKQVTTSESSGKALVVVVEILPGIRITSQSKQQTTYRCQVCRVGSFQTRTFEELSDLGSAF